MPELKKMAMAVKRCLCYDNSGKPALHKKYQF